MSCSLSKRKTCFLIYLWMLLTICFSFGRHFFSWWSIWAQRDIYVSHQSRPILLVFSCCWTRRRYPTKLGGDDNEGKTPGEISGVAQQLWLGLSYFGWHNRLWNRFKYRRRYLSNVYGSSTTRHTTVRWTRRWMRIVAQPMNTIQPGGYHLVSKRYPKLSIDCKNCSATLWMSFPQPYATV